MKHDLFRFLWVLVSSLRCYAVEGDGGGDAGDSGDGGGDAGNGGDGTGGGGEGGVKSTDVRTFMDEKGNFTNPAWAGEGGEALAAKFKTLSGLSKSYANLERQLGNSNKVAIPNENSTDEDRSDFYNRLGRPETAEGYELVKPDSVDEAYWSADDAKGYGEFAHTIGLTKDQASKLAIWQAERVGTAGAANAAEVETMQGEAVAALKKDWGVDYDTNLEAAKRGATATGGQELVAHPLANDPVFIRAMAKVGAMVKEDGSIGIRDTKGGGAAPIQDQIDAIRNDKAGPYYHANHPDHQKMVNRVNALVTKLHPDDK